MRKMSVGIIKLKMKIIYPSLPGEMQNIAVTQFSLTISTGSMKSFETPVKFHVLFPNHKIKPNSKMDECENGASDNFSRMIPLEKHSSKHGCREKIHTHLLENTQPNLLLKRIFQPYLILAKILGCLPLKIHPDGCASFRYFSWNVAYSVTVIGIFCYDTSYFFPIMKAMNSEQDLNPLMYITEIILVSSQIFAALTSYIFIAVKAAKLTRFWNELQGVLVKLVARCPNHLDLVPSYRSARKKIVIWLMFTAVFGTCYITSFHDEITTYLDKQRYNPVWYWTMFSGFAGYSVLLSLHILHSTCFTTFICVLNSCFRTLGCISLKQDGRGEMRNSQSPVLFQEVTEIYDELGELKNLLGRIHGVHIGLEILAMIICVTINLFLMISKPGVSSLFVLNMAIVMPYVIWFHGICESCGELNSSMKSCYRNLRKARGIAAKMVPAQELTPLRVEPPEVLSAAGYFLIDKHLFTTVMGTISTYLVVMLQFNFSSGMNDGSKSIDLSSQYATGQRNASG